MKKIERARIILKIDSLKKEIDRKKSELKSMRDMHSSAWSSYGSELCAGGMQADEYKIEQEIIELDRKIIYLGDCLRDNRDSKSDVVILKNKIKGLEDQIETLEILRKADQDILKWVTFVSKVCSGEQ